jgi:hypothetical protein
MGSVKKKLTKTLRKITPKEIAPILPIAAMMVPGLGPIASNAFLRYGLPQLLTAAGSARTSGKISPLNQALAAFASYSAGPNMQNAVTGKEKAFFDANTNPVDVGYGTGQVDPTFGVTEGLNKGSKLTAPTGTLDAQSLAKANPDAFKAFDYKAPNMMTQAKDLFTPMARSYGDAIANPLGSFGNFAKAVGPGVAASMMDSATKAAMEAEAEAMLAEGNIEGYQNAMNQLVQTMSGMGTDYNPTGAYSGVYTPYADAFRRTANEGGLMGTRTGYNMGGLGSIPQTPTVPQGMQLDGRGGGFIPMGAQERKDDVPAMLAKNEFVMTADAVRAAGGGNIEKGAQKMYDVMNQLESQV